MSATGSKKLSPLKLLLFLILVVGIFPLLLLSFAEVCIRVFAPAPPGSFFLEDQLENGTKVLRANYQAAKRFFPGNLARKPLPEFFPAEKSQKSFRVFVLGESAARGEFLADFSFSRILKAVLQKNYPDRQIEVVNTGIPAINSWVINEICKEIVTYKPDLVIVYAGHNEFIGPYGPASIFSGNAGRQAAKLGIFASSLHLVQLLKSDSLPAELSRGWQGLDMFSKNSIPAGDQRLDVCKSNWNLNLAEILANLKRNSIKTIVCSLPVNFRDCPPFKSIDVANNLEKVIDQLQEFFKQNDWSNLVKVYLEHQDKLQQHALANWLCARAQLELNHSQAAKDLFYLALNNDCFRVRALPSFNQVVKENAQKYAAIFLDLAQEFESSSEQNIIGEDLIYDHVHLSEKGHYLAAAKMFAAMLQNKIIYNAKPSLVFPEFAEVEKLLGYTDSDRIHNLKNIIAAFAAPPFNQQFSHPQRMAALKQTLDKITAAYKAGEAIHQTTEALKSFPEDGRIALRLAQLYSQNGHFAEAQAYFRKSLELNPFNIDALNNFGTLFYSAGQTEQAKPYFIRALKLAPNYANAHFNLALCAAREKKPAEAIEHYQKALAIEPGFATALRNLANLYFEQKNFAKAESYYRQAFAADPSDIISIIGAGNACDANNNPEKARAAFESATTLFPDRPEGYYSLGMLHEKRNQVEVALPFYLTALKKFKHLPSANKVFNLAATGKLATASSNLQEIALACCEASNFNDPWHLQLLGVTYAELGEKEKAATTLGRALDLSRKQGASALATDLENSLKMLSSN